jgi:hypothetical protein
MSVDVKATANLQTRSGFLKTWMETSDTRGGIRIQSETGNIEVMFSSAADLSISATTGGRVTYGIRDDELRPTGVSGRVLQWQIGTGKSILTIISQTGDIVLQEGPFADDGSVKAPGVIKKDLRALPRSQPWTAGDAIKEMPMR